MPTHSWIEVPIEQEIESVPPIGEYAPIFFPPEGAKAVFFFTESTFLQVLSALINGAALTYPDEWLQVVWYFLQNVDYPLDLCEEIANAILTCEDVQSALATVITDDTPVRDAIETLVTTSPAINQYITNVFGRLIPETIAGKLAGGDCDESVVAGRAIAIVERLDANNIDALEILEIGTNDEERLAQILSAFPGFGLLPLDELLDFGQDVLEDFAENYAGASTIERKDAFARLVWCKMKESVDCSITWHQLFDMVKEKIPTAPFDILVTIGDIIQFVGDGDFGDDDLLFYGMMLLNISTITASSNFNGLTAPLLSAITRDALPSSAYLDWDACTPDETCDGGTLFNFEESDLSFVGWADRALWHDEEGFGVNIASGITSQIRITRSVIPHPSRIKVWLSGTGVDVQIYSHEPGVSTTFLASAAYIGPDDIGEMWELDVIPSYDNWLMVSVSAPGAIPDEFRPIRLCTDYDV